MAAAVPPTCKVLLACVSLAFVLEHSMTEASNLPNCTDVLTKYAYPYTGNCAESWHTIQPWIKPTQRAVGYAWVKGKEQSDFDTEKHAQSAMVDEPIPAVIGPGTYLFIVDHHHTLAALDHSGFSDTIVTIIVMCDYRDMSLSDFWAAMEEQNFVYLADHPLGEPNVLPIMYKPENLPITFEFNANSKSFTDDPWRSLSSYSRKVKVAPGFPTCSSSDYKYCERCYDRVCDPNTGGGVSFFEFKWGYFMNYVTFYNKTYWPNIDQWQTFTEIYLALATKYSDVDTDAWQNCADYVIPVCRAPATGEYDLPAYIYGPGELLPGYTEGSAKLGPDPDCGAPICNPNPLTSKQ